MNGQKLERREWTDVMEELNIMINNTEIQLALLRNQFKEAQTHCRGQVAKPEANQ